MKIVYRIAIEAAAIAVESWPGWEAFDAAAPGSVRGPADLTYAAGPVVDLAASSAGLHELQHIRINNGRMSDVDGFLASDLVGWGKAGAQALGAFTVVHGSEIPACVVLLRWPSLQAALDGQIAFESNPAVQETRRAARKLRDQAPIRTTARLFRQSLTYTRNRGDLD
jgi:hypothetical protein